MGDPTILLPIPDEDEGFMLYFPEETEDYVGNTTLDLLRQIKWQPGRKDSPLDYDFDFGVEVRHLLAGIPADDPLMVKEPSTLRGLDNAHASPHQGAEELFELQRLPHKGLGLVATRRIHEGTTLLDEPYLISSLDPPESNQLESPGRARSLCLVQLLSQYTQLSLASRQQFAQLYAHVPGGTHEHWLALLRDFCIDVSHIEFVIRLVRTFSTNEYSQAQAGGWTTNRLFPTISRINHSCQPNCRSMQTTDGRKVVMAAREIASGEELTIRYVDARQFRSRAEWEVHTQAAWGFVCSCEGCAGMW